MAIIINLTPRAIHTYAENAFVNLVQANPTTFTTEGVEGEAIAVFESVGNARISVTTTGMPSKL
jgi:hypothetical protein